MENFGDDLVEVFDAFEIYMTKEEAEYHRHHEHHECDCESCRQYMERLR